MTDQELCEWAVARSRGAWDAPYVARIMALVTAVAEHGTPTDEAAATGTTHARLRYWKDRTDEMADEIERLKGGAR